MIPVELSGRPYAPHMVNLSGTYAVFCGGHFYLGSTTMLGRRVSSHRAELVAGKHPNSRLQELFNAGHSFGAVLLKEIPRKRDDTDKSHRVRLELNEQWLLNEWFGTPFCLNRSSESGFNSTISGVMKAKWQDPGFREKMLAANSARGPVSDETRARMSSAKLGSRNPKSRGCVLELHGKRLRFESESLAARHFGVTQQAMHGWLTGLIPWPGTGVRAPRRKDLIGLTGRLLG
jgi:hypothetical protein